MLLYPVLNMIRNHIIIQILEDEMDASPAPIHEELEQHPQIHLQDVEYIDINTFNRLAASNDLILSAECWSGVHPLLVTLPVEWNYRFPYGLIYTKNPSKEVLQFIMAIGQVRID